MNETGINNIIQINKNVFSQYLVSDIISDISLDNNKIKYLTFHWNLSISEPWINMNLCNMNFQFIDNITWFFNIRPSLTWDANITSFSDLRDLLVGFYWLRVDTGVILKKSCQMQFIMNLKQTGEKVSR